MCATEQAIETADDNDEDTELARRVAERFCEPFLTSDAAVQHSKHNHRHQHVSFRLQLVPQPEAQCDCQAPVTLGAQAGYALESSERQRQQQVPEAGVLSASRVE